MTGVPAMTGASVVAALAAALAAALVGPSAGSPRDGAAGPSRVRRLRAGPLLGAGLATGCGVVLLTLDGTRLALALVLAGALAGCGVLARRAAGARAAERRRDKVVELCEALVGELRAGQPLVASVEHCRDAWPELDPVVAAARLGADVPAALRRLSQLPGAEGLLEVAAAWQIAHASGAGLATALGQVAASARTRAGTRLLVRGELASAQATARLVALLPLGSLAMAAGIGGDPWHFLLATPVGVGCLGAGVLLVLAGLLWIDRIAAAVLA